MFSLIFRTKSEFLHDDFNASENMLKGCVLRKYRTAAFEPGVRMSLRPNVVTISFRIHTMFCDGGSMSLKSTIDNH